jgi:hypothetical protein
VVAVKPTFRESKCELRTQECLGIPTKERTHGGELLAEPPRIEQVDVLAAKLTAP